MNLIIYFLAISNLNIYEYNYIKRVSSLLQILNRKTYKLKYIKKTILNTLTINYIQLL